MARRITVQERVAELVREHGSYQLAGNVVGMTRTRLWEIATGRRGAGSVSLRALGLDPDSAVYARLTRTHNEGTR